MAGQAKIGALHVSLGLDSAQFQTGLKKAETGLGRFSKGAKIALAAVATAAVAAGAALGIAVKNAIDHADQLSKTSQKIGVTTEALSRLEWAAKLSDVSLEQLSGGLKKLSQNLFEVGSGAGATAQRGFDALGISATNANGSLRSADEVLADVADKFSRMEDGTAKTAIAVALFGRAGAELIPMLNMGKDGLADMAAEADRLGITISGKTGRAAEAFNDSMTRLQAVFQGVVNKVMVSVLPSLNQLGDMLASPEFAASAQQIGGAIVDGMKLAVDAINTVTGALQSLRDGMEWMGSHDMFGNKTGPTAKQVGMGKGRAQLDLKRAFARGDRFDPSGFMAGFGGSGGSAGGAGGGGPSEITPFTPAIGGAKALKEEIEITIPRVTEMQQAFIDLGTTIDSSVSSAFSGVVKSIIKGEDAVGGLIGKVGELGDKLIDMALDQAIQGLFGNLMGIFSGGMGLGGGGFGRATYGGGGGFFPAFPRFEGGGFTGAGSRIGGIDGRGGFPAILHPNETVIDHSEERAGGGLEMTFNINGSRQDAAEIAAIARREAMDVVRTYQANPYRRN